jgi:hypothetical protein
MTQENSRMAASYSVVLRENQVIPTRLRRGHG